MPLNDTFLRNLKSLDKVKKYSDGEGLYLHVDPAGGKYWRMAYRFDGKQKTLSFGSYPTVSLKDARKRREEAKQLLASDIDPSAEKKRIKTVRRVAQQELANTFALTAEEWFAKHSQTLTENHANKLRRYLNKTIYPAIGNKPITQCEPADFLEVVKSAEAAGHIETAHKLLGLCGQVMSYAKIKGLIKYDVVTGLTKALTPKKVQHLAAITDPKKIGQLLRDIDEYKGHFSVVYCLKILPYVFTRPSELRLAEWSEFDFKEKIWSIPASRMKMRREHVVPLSEQVIKLLRELHYYSGEFKYLFPSIRTVTTTISDAAPLAALRRLGYTQEETCLHGFRSTASTSLNELGYRPDVIESQLAHKDPDGVRLAYNRAEYMNERRKLMQAWANYLDELKKDGQYGDLP